VAESLVQLTGLGGDAQQRFGDGAAVFEELLDGGLASGRTSQ
jgi:hypothetical protein